MAHVWAFQLLPELDNKTGLVECDDTLAALLIESGKAQDPRVGNPGLKDIIDKPVAPKAEYDTKVMTPKPTRGK